MLAALSLLGITAAPVPARADEPSPGPTMLPTTGPTTGLEPTSAEDLLELLPLEVAGQPLLPNTAAASEVLALAPDPDIVEELSRIAAANGGDIAGLRYASAGVSNDYALAIVIAVSIPGLDAELIEAPVRAILLPQSSDAQVSQEEVAGRTVTKITRRGLVAPDDVVWVLTRGEVLFLIVADPTSLLEIVAALP